MLVISRKVGESIYIGDDISIVITKTGETSVRLSISAPREIAIFRGELLGEVEQLQKAFQVPAKTPRRNLRRA